MLKKMTLLTILLVIMNLRFGLHSTVASIQYDRDAARAAACLNNHNDGSFRGYTEGRYSPTYIAYMLNAGGISLSSDYRNIVGIHQIQQWMIDHPNAWEERSDANQLEHGDFLFFSAFSDVSPTDLHQFDHAAVFLNTACPNGTTDRNYIATWNNERLNITENNVTRVGDPARDKLDTVYIHILDNAPPPAPVFQPPIPGPNNVGLNPIFNFTQGNDPDGDTVSLEIWFGEPGNLTLLVGNLPQSTTSFRLPYDTWDSGGYQPGTTYRFRITADDGNHPPVTTDYDFTTSYAPPAAILDPQVEEHNVGLRPTFDFTQGADPDGDALTVEIWFGPVGSLRDSLKLKYPMRYNQPIGRDRNIRDGTYKFTQDMVD